jgi:hypothetical protein
VDWIGLAQDRGQSVESSCEHGNEPSGSIKFWEILRVATQLEASPIRFQLHGISKY